MMEIPLNVNEVGVPLCVRKSLLAEDIAYRCQELRIEVPKGIQGYIRAHYHKEPSTETGAGFRWLDRLLKASSDMSPELLQRWIEALPPGCHFFRAEMRGVLKTLYNTSEG